MTTRRNQFLSRDAGHIAMDEETGEIAGQMEAVSAHGRSSCKLKGNSYLKISTKVITPPRRTESFSDSDPQNSLCLLLLIFQSVLLPPTSRAHRYVCTQRGTLKKMLT